MDQYTTVYLGQPYEWTPEEPLSRTLLQDIEKLTP